MKVVTDYDHIKEKEKEHLKAQTAVRRMWYLGFVAVIVAFLVGLLFVLSGQHNTANIFFIFAVGMLILIELLIIKIEQNIFYFGTKMNILHSNNKLTKEDGK